MFENYLDRWRLDPDGEPIMTTTSRLLPVRRDGVPAMLKVATEPEERRGADTMTWWDGNGAAHVLTHEVMPCSWSVPKAQRRWRRWQ